MTRAVAAAVGALGLLAVGNKVNATLTPIVFASATGPREVLVDVDLNGDGPGPGDCDYRARLDLSGGALAVISTQNPPVATQRILGCDGETDGSASFGSSGGNDAIAITTTSSTYAPPSMPMPPPGTTSPIILPGLLQFTQASAAAAGQLSMAGSVAFPVNVNQLTIRVPADGPVNEVITACDASGPAGIFNVGGTAVLVSFSFFTSGGGNTFVEVPSSPFRRSDGIALLDVFIPVLGHKIIAALEDDQEHPLAVVDFDALAPCGGRSTAPTMTEAGLIGLLLLLLAAGMWHLGRRPMFYGSLPIV